MLRSSSLSVAILVLALSTPSHADRFGRLARRAAQPSATAETPMVQPPAPASPAVVGSEPLRQVQDKPSVDYGYPFVGKCGSSWASCCCDGIWDDYCATRCGCKRWQAWFRQARCRSAMSCGACGDLKGGLGDCGVPSCDTGCGGAKQVGCASCGAVGGNCGRHGRLRRPYFQGYGCGGCVEALGCESGCKGCGDAGWSQQKGSDMVVPQAPTPAPREVRPPAEKSVNRWPLPNGPQLQPAQYQTWSRW